MILSIDPGIANLGFAIIDNHNEKIILTKHLQTTSDDSTIERINQITSLVSSYIANYNIQHIVLEELYSFGKKVYLLQVSQVIGAISQLSIQSNIPLHRVNPSHMKKIITDNGKADKDEILGVIMPLIPEHMYQRIYTMPKKKKEHIIDAIGIGITYVRDFVNPDFLKKKKEKKKMTLFG